jgi:hypothetical protein
MAEWRAQEVSRRKWVQRGALVVGRYLASTRKAVADAVSEAITPEGALSFGTAAASDPKKVTAMLADIWITTGKAYAIDSRKRLANQKAEWWDIVDFWEQWVYGLITSEFTQKITGIDATTQKAIQKALQDGVEQGMSVQDMAEMIIKGDIPNMDKARAIRIARTEVIGASNAGSIQGARSMGIKGLKKKWLVALDGRERMSHAEVSAQTILEPIDIDDKFNVGGSIMDYPGDPMGDADQVINCRCAVSYVTPLFG